MRLLIIIVTFLTISSCDRETESKRLFEMLRGQNFKIRNEEGDEMTIEFVDSKFYVLLSGKDSVKAATIGTWRIDSGITGVFLFENNTIDSTEMKVDKIYGDTIIFKYHDKKVNFTKSEKQLKDIIGNWRCYLCDSIPPSPKETVWRQPMYTFDSTGHFEIKDGDLNQKGSWTFSPSGELVILNQIYKSGDRIFGELLILGKSEDGELKVNRVNNWGTVITRRLERLKN